MTIIINDEAHHCYRHKDSGGKKMTGDEKEEARKHEEAAGQFCALMICIAAFALVAYAISKGEGNFGGWIFAGSVALAGITAISLIARHVHSGQSPQPEDKNDK